MKTKHLLIIGGVAIAAFAGWWFFLRKPKAGAGETTAEGSGETSGEGAVLKGGADYAPSQVGGTTPTTTPLIPIQTPVISPQPIKPLMPGLPMQPIKRPPITAVKASPVAAIGLAPKVTMQAVK